MTAKNTLVTAVPYQVERALKQLGANLRIARLRRKLTIAEVAEKIGTGPRAITAAEAGKPSTGVAVYAALLWVYGLLTPFGKLADPHDDEIGQAMTNIGQRARRTRGLDNDF